jgi:hypothetical protein
LRPEDSLANEIQSLVEVADTHQRVLFARMATIPRKALSDEKAK